MAEREDLLIIDGTFGGGCLTGDPGDPLVTSLGPTH